MYIIVLTGILTLAVVGVHYESLRFTTVWLLRAKIPRRSRVMVAVLVSLMAHLVGAGIFTLGWVSLEMSGLILLSEESMDLRDVYYFSLITYTSVGYGDIVPLGEGRILAGVESLVGLVLIAWTASYTFLQMQRYWLEDHDKPPIQNPES